MTWEKEGDLVINNVVQPMEVDNPSEQLQAPKTGTSIGLTISSTPTTTDKKTDEQTANEMLKNAINNHNITGPLQAPRRKRPRSRRRGESQSVDVIQLLEQSELLHFVDEQFLFAAPAHHSEADVAKGAPVSHSGAGQTSRSMASSSAGDLGADSRSGALRPQREGGERILCRGVEGH